MRKLRFPDFRAHAGLNAIRALLRAELIEFVGHRISSRVSREDLERLETTGLDVTMGDVQPLEDGTLAFFGEPVVLYILTPRTNEPKFHIFNCHTYENMKMQGRQDRYVASTRVDGLFEVERLLESGRSKRQLTRLDVCQNCLDRSGWKGFHKGMYSSEKRHLVQSFVLKEFFESRPRGGVVDRPKWTPEPSPSGTYTKDFDEISAAARKSANWTCSAPGCGRSFTKSFERRFLHVHHKNGVAGDNSPSNLMVLCLGHHAMQPKHSHMRSHRDYSIFVRAYKFAQ